MPRIASSIVVEPKKLSESEREALVDALYRIQCEVFDGVTKESFAKYVVLSRADRTWIQIHRNDAGETVGYFALHHFERSLRGQLCSVYRAEAGSLRAYRGGNAIARHIVEQGIRHFATHPTRPTYYLGSLVHPSSYVLVSKYFRRVWPNAEQQPAADVLAFMSEVADEFGIAPVDPANPLVRKVGWRTRDTEAERNYWRECDKPTARFFIEANPGYGEGNGLLTLVPVNAADVAEMGRRIVAGRAERRLEALTAAAHRLPIASRLLRPEAVQKRLRETALFSAFSAESLESLAKNAEIEALPPGRYLFRAGDRSDDVYIVAHGAVYVTAEQEGREHIVDQLRAGAMVGEIAMLSGQVRTASVRTATPSILIRLRGKTVRAAFEQNPDFRDAVWQSYVERQLNSLTEGTKVAEGLSRAERREWAQQGKPVELLPGGTATFDAASADATSLLFLVSGCVELQSPQGGWALLNGPALVEVRRPLRVAAREAARLVHLPGVAKATEVRATA